jgi:hypothetical protein
MSAGMPALATVDTAQATEPGQVERVLRVALDGLRYRPEA